ncbi:hypothetical protein BGX27_005387 [Mortierella sp. AM989]|nr:hypothetical protein BGX27_005387 [Mortierella sp. AM989]
MREPNFSFPNQNRAAICITSSIYDRRALDCTDYIPIINTLTNLAYLTGSTPTIREFITRDGGLERLVTILKTTKVNDRKNGLKWTLAFQCVVNIGVRGTEHIRKRVVQAGMVPVIVHVLESFFTVLKSVNDENERRRLLRRTETAQQNSQIMISDGDHSTDSQPFTAPMSDESDQQLQVTGLDTSNNSSSSSLSSSSIIAPTLATSSEVTTTSIAVEPSTVNLEQEPTRIFQNGLYNNNTLDHTQGPSTMPTNQEQSVSDNARSIPMDAGDGRPQQIFYREDDILHSLQLLAYLSKYPSLRSSFHTDSGSNVFAIVEKFTHRTMHPMEIQYWAGVIMRNACRKDDSRKGIRQCAYTGCGKWESKPREFAKCRRCRKAKYCSKQCQSKAWNEGHRWWCIEKKPESMGVSSSFGTDLPPAPPPPPPPADLQDQPETAPNIMENGGITSMTTGTAGTMMIGGGQGGNSTGHHVHHIQRPTQHHRQDQSQHHYQPPHPQPQLSAQVATSSSSSTQAASPVSQQYLLQRQQLILPQQPQTSQAPYYAAIQQQPRQQPAPEHFAHDHQGLQQMQMQQQRQLQAMQQQRLSQMRPAPGLSSSPRPMVQPPQRSMSQSHPSTAPIRPSSRTELTPHLGISPDSPTPEQLAQRFVQQAALYPGQHNELAQNLHAQFQQYFPPHHQAEAKRQFSFHARELFARHQRQQELLRNGGLGSSLNPARRSTPHSTPLPSVMTTSSSSPTITPSSNSHVDPSKQGIPRRRSDLDSDEEYPSPAPSSRLTSTSFSIPMLTQDLSTTMSLSSMELSGPPSTSLMEAHLSNEPNSIHTSSIGGESDETKAEQTSVRDFKVRKLMTREESSRHEGSSSTGITNHEPAQREDEWSYSRHMAKDTSVDP